MNKKKLIIIIASALVVLFIIGCIIYLVLKEEDNELSQFSDKSSQPNLLVPDAPIFINFTKLIDRGIDQDAFIDIRYLITTENERQKLNFKEIALQPETIKHMIDNGSHIYTADIIIDNTEGYILRLSYDTQPNMLVTLEKDTQEIFSLYRYEKLLDDGTSH